MSDTTPLSDPAPAENLSAGVVKRPFVLADGRDLIYFDDPDTTLPAERAADARTLDPRPATARMRQDVLTGEWITIAAARQNRVVLPPAELDPLAPASPTNPSEVPNDYDVVVFENRSPSFGPLLDDIDAPADQDELRSLGLGRSRTSVGRCEVICFSPEHEGSLSTQSTTRVRTIIEAWADRVAALSALPAIAQVFPFENRGEAIGVTLHHPHGQIYGYPYITPRTTRLIASVEEYGAGESGGGLFADILAFEQAGERVLIRGEHWTAFVPFAARWPLEIHMLPHRAIPDLAATNEAERDELAVLYPRLLRGLDALYDTPTPYIGAWHQAPTTSHRDDIRLMLQVTSPRRGESKLKFLAGSESAMGAFIGDVPPETSAQALREAIARADAASAAAADAVSGAGASGTVSAARPTLADRSIEGFTAAYGEAPAGVWAAPGRANLIGEHTDYNDGFVFPFAIDSATAAAIRVRDDRRIRLATAFSDEVFEGDLDELDEAWFATFRADTTRDHWPAYPLGVVWALAQHAASLEGTSDASRPGIDVFIDSDVPVGAGLSSSAAVMCAIAIALDEIWGLGLERPTLARIGQLAENKAVGAPTGIMDESASLLGRRDSAVFLDCRSLDSDVIPLGFEEAGLELLVIDTHVSHSHATGGYAARRASCERGARELGVGSLRDLDVDDLARAEEVLDDETFRRVRHIITENARVLDVVKTLRTEGPRAIGALLDAGHVSLRDDFEISVPELDTAVEAAQASGAIGARMTGGGFGGSAIALVPVESSDRVREAVITAFAEKGFLAPTVFVVRAADGAHRLV